MDVGRELREARIRSGLSPEELAQRTQLRIRDIEAVEDNTLSEAVPGHVYAHVVRRYAAAVGCDADALMRTPEFEPSATIADVFRSEADLDREQEVRSLPEAPPPSARQQPTGRLIALALIATIVAAFGAGAYIYERAMAPSKGSSVAEGSAVAEGSVADPPADRPDVPSVADAGSAPVGGPVVGLNRAEDGGADVPSESSRGPGSAPAAPPTPSPGSAGSPAPVPASDVAGPWTLTTEVQSSAVAAFEGLRLRFDVDLQQDGDRITGRGRKVSENGVSIPMSRQTPISVKGIQSGERLSLAFTEVGRRRPSAGTFELVRQNDAVWRGRFSSDAARSTGTAEARRE